MSSVHQSRSNWRNPEPSRSGNDASRSLNASSGTGYAFNDRSNALANLRMRQREEEQQFDQKMGYSYLDADEERIGYLFNMLPVTIAGGDGRDRSSLDCYFLEQNGSTFKATVPFEPYLYLFIPLNCHDREREIFSTLERRFDTLIFNMAWIEKSDLDMPNHLSGKGTRRILEVRCRTSNDLNRLRSQLRPIVELSNRLEKDGKNIQVESISLSEPLLLLTDMREYDVPFTTRVCIDNEIRVGYWYSVRKKKSWNEGMQEEGKEEGVEGHLLTRLAESFPAIPEPHIMAFDIECTKAPLKFPHPDTDVIYMFSYMLDSNGFLLINREIVSEDIDDFEYTPKPVYPGKFTCINLPNEAALLQYWIRHVQAVRPHVFVTYNGDSFDWPFIHIRCRLHGIDMKKEIGICNVLASSTNFGNRDGSFEGEGTVGGENEYRGRTSVHLDCLYWVKRDSYLPQGSHGLKAVTRAKLGYDPVEIDPEMMLPMAHSQPKYMASYSVSDAVSTYYLYRKYVHDFIFSLSMIIPLPPEDILRKGSGTLCEMLLMVEAYRNGIICPNKQLEELSKTYKGHLLDSETYIGGHVECLESGIFRQDLPIHWKFDKDILQNLINHVDEALTFAIEIEHGLNRHDIENYQEIKEELLEKLELLRDFPVREEKPMIYHLDVGAMYPNIILTNRLQPPSVVTEDFCAQCDYSMEQDADCQRRMEWKWRGDYFPPRGDEVRALRSQLQNEDIFQDEENVSPAVLDKHLRDRVKKYSQKVYKRVKDTVEETVEALICQRENPFYVDTVRAFRDRRYEYKLLTSKWNGKLREAQKKGDTLEIDLARGRTILYDSLQLAHKCILNSFYGYVMRKGARWRSMAMAGVVTYTGAMLIQRAAKVVGGVGRLLELDTDGIWCVLPSSFPQKLPFQTKSGKKINVMYPCVMLNLFVHKEFTNHQYQDRMDSISSDSTPGGTGTTKEQNEYHEYATREECSIYFELDGPYSAMVLPASQEEGRLLKKRYAVFHLNGSLAELKGFELKRRGELMMIKHFQEKVFERFLDGQTLQDCYNSVAKIADWWLNILDTFGEDVEESTLIDYLSEHRSLSKALDDYGGQKSLSISTARRLAEFLGSEAVKDKGLQCKLVVAKYPSGAPVTERAIPTVIFAAEPSVRQYYLRRWLKEPSLTDFSLRNILDWDYYRSRLGSAVQKIITIPAGLQGLPNPVPRVPHPPWLDRLLLSKMDTKKQLDLRSFFTLPVQKAPKGSGSTKDLLKSITVDAQVELHDSEALVKDPAHTIEDIEDSFLPSSPKGPTQSRKTLYRKGGSSEHEKDSTMDTEDAAVEDPNAQLSSDSTGSAKEYHNPTHPEPLPDNASSEELQSWLAHRKKIWRMRCRRKRTQSDSDVLPTPPVSSGTGSSSKSMYSSVQDVRMHSLQDHTPIPPLQVLEVREITNSPGMFLFVAGTGPRRISHFVLEYQRPIYLHSETSLEKSPLYPKLRLLSPHTLPHSIPCSHLYKMDLPERRLRRLHQYLRQNLTMGAQRETVFGTLSPLLISLLTSIGTVNDIIAVDTDASNAVSPAIQPTHKLASTTPTAKLSFEDILANSSLLSRREGSKDKRKFQFSGPVFVPPQTVGAIERLPSHFPYLEPLSLANGPAIVLQHKQTASLTFRNVMLFHAGHIPDVTPTSSTAKRSLTVVAVPRETNRDIALHAYGEMEKQYRMASLRGRSVPSKEPIESTSEGILRNLPLPPAIANALMHMAKFAVAGIDTPMTIDFHVFVTAPSPTAKRGDSTALSRTSFLRSISTVQTSAGSNRVTANATVTVLPPHEGSDGLFRRLNALLVSLHPDQAPTNPPFIVSIASTAAFSLDKWQANVRALQSLCCLPFPLPPVAAEQMHLGWAETLSNRALYVYLTIGQQLPWLIQFARDSQIPLANCVHWKYGIPSKELESIYVRENTAVPANPDESTVRKLVANPAEVQSLQAEHELYLLTSSEWKTPLALDTPLSEILTLGQTKQSETATGEIDLVQSEEQGPPRLTPLVPPKLVFNGHSLLWNFTIDVQMLRLMEVLKIVPWTSPVMPDTGGASSNTSAALMSIPTRPLLRNLVLSSVPGTPSPRYQTMFGGTPSLSVPTYLLPTVTRNVVVSLRMEGLLLTALLAMEELVDVEISNSLQQSLPNLEGKDAIDTNSSESNSAKRDADFIPTVPPIYLKLLSRFVQHLVSNVLFAQQGTLPQDDIPRQRSSVHEYLLEHIDAWLSPPQSLLSDPLVLTAVSRYYNQTYFNVIKAVQEVLEEINSKSGLGTQGLNQEVVNEGNRLILVTDSQLVIETNKQNALDAYEIVQTIVEQLSKNQKFAFLSLIPTNTWFGMLFVDATNFCGISATTHPQTYLSVVQRKVDASNTPDAISLWQGYSPNFYEDPFLCFHTFLQEACYSICEAAVQCGTFELTESGLIDGVPNIEIPAISTKQWKQWKKSFRNQVQSSSDIVQEWAFAEVLPPAVSMALSSLLNGFMKRPFESQTDAIFDRFMNFFTAEVEPAMLEIARDGDIIRMQTFLTGLHVPIHVSRAASEPDLSKKLFMTQEAASSELGQTETSKPSISTRGVVASQDQLDGGAEWQDEEEMMFLESRNMQQERGPTDTSVNTLEPTIKPIPLSGAQSTARIRASAKTLGEKIFARFHRSCVKLTRLQLLAEIKQMHVTVKGVTSNWVIKRLLKVLPEIESTGTVQTSAIHRPAVLLSQAIFTILSLDPSIVEVVQGYRTAIAAVLSVREAALLASPPPISTLEGRKDATENRFSTLSRQSAAPVSSALYMLETGPLSMRTFLLSRVHCRSCGKGRSLDLHKDTHIWIEKRRIVPPELWPVEKKRLLETAASVLKDDDESGADESDYDDVSSIIEDSEEEFHSSRPSKEKKGKNSNATISLTPELEKMLLIMEEENAYWWDIYSREYGCTEEYEHDYYIWRCSCEAEYRREYIEATLVKELHAMVYHYSDQDLVCTKCQLSPSSLTSLTCTCKGDYITEIPIQDLRDGIELFQSIALRHKFQWLLEAVEIYH